MTPPMIASISVELTDVEEELALLVAVIMGVMYGIG
jgi:hypothetical protein